jgi:hypothetical protein
MDSRILANFGIINGLNNERGLVYVGKTAGGTYFAAVLHAETVEGEVVERWRYYRQSVIKGYRDAGDLTLASGFNLEILTDNATPDFIVEGDTSVWPLISTVVNAEGTKRLFQGDQPYTVKGQGVTASEIEAVKLAGAAVSATAGSSTTGTTTAATGAMGFIPTDFSLLFSNPIKFVQDNALFVGIVLAVVYWTRRKKKKPLWIF